MPIDQLHEHATLHEVHDVRRLEPLMEEYDGQVMHFILGHAVVPRVDGRDGIQLVHETRVPFSGEEDSSEATMTKASELLIPVVCLVHGQRLENRGGPHCCGG